MIDAWRASALALLMLFALAACATPQRTAEPAPRYKVGNPYKVNGRWYRPKADPNYDEIGVASWYGGKFHGRLTANGEIFDKNLLTAAHTTLPMPSLVEVKNLENGRKIMVRVNDRGPFARGRIIDLSQAAAKRLGFDRQGLARVRVRYAGPAPLPRSGSRKPPAPEIMVAQAPQQADMGDVGELIKTLGGDTAAADAAPPAPSIAPAPVAAVQETQALYAVRVAALWSLDYIDTLRGELSAVGPLRLSRIETPAGEAFYRVNMGPYADRAEAARRLEAVREAGYADAALVTITP